MAKSEIRLTMSAGAVVQNAHVRHNPAKTGPLATMMTWSLQDSSLAGRQTSKTCHSLSSHRQYDAHLGIKMRRFMDMLTCFTVV